MKSYNMWSFVTGFFRLAPKVYFYRNMFRYFIAFYGCIIFQCADILSSLGHLGCFHLGAIMNNAALAHAWTSVCVDVFSILSLGMQLLGLCKSHSLNKFLRHWRCEPG